MTDKLENNQKEFNRNVAVCNDFVTFFMQRAFGNRYGSSIASRMSVKYDESTLRHVVFDLDLRPKGYTRRNNSSCFGLRLKYFVKQQQFRLYYAPCSTLAESLEFIPTDELDGIIKDLKCDLESPTQWQKSFLNKLIGLKL